MRLSNERMKQLGKLALSFEADFNIVDESTVEMLYGKALVAVLRWDDSIRIWVSQL